MIGPRAPSALLAVVVALALSSPFARARAASPRPNEDIDLPLPKQKPKPPPREREPEPLEDPSTTPDETAAEDVFVPGRKPAVQPATLTGSKLRPDSAAAPDAGLAPDAGSPAQELALDVKPLVLPPADGDAQLVRSWARRKEALAGRDFRSVQEADKLLRSLKEELGYDNLFVVSAALDREAEALLASDPTEAVARARLAAELSPDLPSAYWVLARTAFAEDKIAAGRYLGALAEGARRVPAEPRWRSVLMLDAAVGGLVALLVAGVLTLLLVFARHARYALHDFHHLFPTGASPLQTGLLAFMLLAVPVAFGLGPFLALSAVALGAWLYMSRVERVAVALFLASLAALPSLAGHLAQRSAFVGTAAESVYLVEKGGVDPTNRLAALKELADRGEAGYQAHFVLGLDALRRGAVDDAMPFLRRAAEARPASPEVLLELGNAMFLRGDLEGARDAYARAAENAPSYAQAYFNLSRALARRSQMSTTREQAGAELSKAQDASHRATELDPGLLTLVGAEPDMRASRHLASARLPPEAVAELLGADPGGAGVEAQVRKRLFGPLGPAGGFLAPMAVIAALAALWLASAKLHPSTSCQKCGRPVCRRCDGVVSSGFCGQCAHLFAAKSEVDPPARVAKEISIRRYQKRREGIIKIVAMLVCGSGHLLVGRTLRGVAYLACWALLVYPLVMRTGPVRPPFGEVPGALRALPAALLLAALWLVAARNAFALFRSGEPKQ